MENNQNPFEDKRNDILDWKEIAKIHCKENEFILAKAKDLRNSGLRVMDSLHRLHKMAARLCEKI
jgi:hypothetical protein